MITKEEFIKAGEIFFIDNDIEFFPEKIKYEEIDIRFPANDYFWSSAIQLNFKYKDEYYFIDMGYRQSTHTFRIQGWHKDYKNFADVFNFPYSLMTSVLGHFSGYDREGSYTIQPFRNKHFVPANIKLTKLFEMIEEIIEAGNGY